MLITNARILTFDAANRVLDSGSVEILPDGTIGAVHPNPQPSTPNPQDAEGRVLMPALINCHTHLYSTLARGLALPGRPPRNFPEILRKLWWRLDCALNPDDIYHSALIGLIDSAKNGVATLIDHHSSPNACPGSLDRIEQAFREVGLRGALCYETSDRNGPAKAAEAIQENIRFIEGHSLWGRPSGLHDGLPPGGTRREPSRQAESLPHDDMVGATFGLHASFTLGDRTLRRCVEANESLHAGFHIHVAEDFCDRNAVRRLDKAGVLDERTLAAHCLHISATDMNTLARHRVNVIHNPQSNCSNGVGVAKTPELIRHGVTVGLGSDGYSPRIWDEFKTALHLQKPGARDPAPLLNNRSIIQKLWGLNLGRIEPGAKADLILVDYYPPTPLRPDNLLGHLLFGVSNAPIDSLIVSGRFVVRNRQCVTVDERAIAEKAAVQAKSLWSRLA